MRFQQYVLSCCVRWAALRYTVCGRPRCSELAWCNIWSANAMVPVSVESAECQLWAHAQAHAAEENHGSQGSCYAVSNINETRKVACRRTLPKSTVQVHNDLLCSASHMTKKICNETVTLPWPWQHVNTAWEIVQRYTEDFHEGTEVQITNTPLLDIIQQAYSLSQVLLQNAFVHDLKASIPAAWSLSWSCDTTLSAASPLTDTVQLGLCGRCSLSVCNVCKTSFFTSSSHGGYISFCCSLIEHGNKSWHPGWARPCSQ